LGFGGVYLQVDADVSEKHAVSIFGGTKNQDFYNMNMIAMRTSNLIELTHVSVIFKSHDFPTPLKEMRLYCDQL
jgi:hypothetical protein